MSIFLIRHASAGRRQPHTKDIDRPLDERGFEQANRIAETLDGIALQLILTSPALRCHQTVEPLAKVHGVDIERNPHLSEGQSAAGALALANRLAAAEVDAALCSHGDILPALLDTLAGDGVPLDGAGCAKGSIWTLEIQDGRISRGHYTPAP